MFHQKQSMHTKYYEVTFAVATWPVTQCFDKLIAEKKFVVELNQAHIFDTGHKQHQCVQDNAKKMPFD